MTDPRRIIEKMLLYMGICALVALTGCKTAPLPPPEFAPGEQYRPTVAIVYYPFGKCFGRTIAEPLPNYSSWTDGRMDRDLRRISQSGVDVVALMMPLEEIGSGEDAEFVLQRYSRFLELALNARPRPLSVMLCVESANYDAKNMQTALAWIVLPSTLAHKALFRADGKPLVVLANGMDACRERHPAIKFRRASPKGDEWLWDSPSSPTTQLGAGNIDRQVFIRAGLVASVAGGQVTWKAPRDKGKTLRYAFWHAYRARARFIVVSSWNDFVSGDFIEPNSLDKERTMETLTEEIARVSALQSTQ